jgi:hypothetical protein
MNQPGHGSLDRVAFERSGSAQSDLSEGSRELAPNHVLLNRRIACRLSRHYRLRKAGVRIELVIAVDR